MARDLGLETPLPVGQRQKAARKSCFFADSLIGRLQGSVCADGEHQRLMGRDGALRGRGAVGEVPPGPAGGQQLQRAGVGAAIAPVAGGAAHRSLGADGLRQFPADAVPLAVVAHLEEVRPQLCVVDAAIPLPVGVPGQEDAGAPVVQGQHEAEVVHPGVQSGEPLPEPVRLHGFVECPHQRRQLRLPCRRRRQDAEPEPLAQRASISRGQGSDGGAAVLQPGAEGAVVVQCPEEFALGGCLRKRFVQGFHAVEKVCGKGLPESGGRQHPGRRQRGADVVLVDVGGDQQVQVVQPPGGQILRQGHAAGGAVRVLGRLGAAAVDEQSEDTAGRPKVRALQQDGLAVAHVDKGQFQFFHRQLFNGALDVEAGEEEDQHRHDDGAGAAEAEVQVVDAVVVKELGNGGGSARRAAAGEDVHLLEEAEGVDGPQQGAQGQAALDIGDGDVPELLDDAGAVDAGGLVLALRHGLEAGVQQQKHKGRVLPHIDEQNGAEGGLGIHEPVEDRQAQAGQELVDDAVVGGEHHAPAQGHRDGGQQIGQQKQGAHGLLAPPQAIDENRDQQAQGHLKHHCQQGERDGVPDRLAEISVLKQVGVVFEQHESGGLVGVLQVIVICKAVNKGENQGICRQDDHDQQSRRDHQAGESPLAQMGRLGLPGP